MPDKPDDLDALTSEMERMFRYTGADPKDLPKPGIVQMGLDLASRPIRLMAGMSDAGVSALKGDRSAADEAADVWRAWKAPAGEGFSDPTIPGSFTDVLEHADVPQPLSGLGGLAADLFLDPVGRLRLFGITKAGMAAEKMGVGAGLSRGMMNGERFLVGFNAGLNPFRREGTALVAGYKPLVRAMEGVEKARMAFYRSPYIRHFVAGMSSGMKELDEVAERAPFEGTATVRTALEERTGVPETIFAKNVRKEIEDIAAKMFQGDEARAQDWFMTMTESGGGAMPKRAALDKMRAEGNATRAQFPEELDTKAAARLDELHKEVGDLQEKTFKTTHLGRDIGMPGAKGTAKVVRKGRGTEVTPGSLTRNIEEQLDDPVVAGTIGRHQMDWMNWVQPEDLEYIRMIRDQIRTGGFSVDSPIAQWLQELVRNRDTGTLRAIMEIRFGGPARTQAAEAALRGAAGAANQAYDMLHNMTKHMTRDLPDEVVVWSRRAPAETPGAASRAALAGEEWKNAGPSTGVGAHNPLHEPGISTNVYLDYDEARYEAGMGLRGMTGPADVPPLDLVAWRIKREDLALANEVATRFNAGDSAIAPHGLPLPRSGFLVRNAALKRPIRITAPGAEVTTAARKIGAEIMGQLELMGFSRKTSAAAARRVIEHGEFPEVAAIMEAAKDEILNGITNAMSRTMADPMSAAALHAIGEATEFQRAFGALLAIQRQSGVEALPLNDLGLFYATRYMKPEVRALMTPTRAKEFSRWFRTFYADTASMKKRLDILQGMPLPEADDFLKTHYPGLVRKLKLAGTDTFFEHDPAILLKIASDRARHSVTVAKGGQALVEQFGRPITVETMAAGDIPMSQYAAKMNLSTVLPHPAEAVSAQRAVADRTRAFLQSIVEQDPALYDQPLMNFTAHPVKKAAEAAKALKHQIGETELKFQIPLGKVRVEDVAPNAGKVVDWPLITEIRLRKAGRGAGRGLEASGSWVLDFRAGKTDILDRVFKTWEEAVAHVRGLGDDVIERIDLPKEITQQLREMRNLGVNRDWIREQLKRDPRKLDAEEVLSVLHGTPEQKAFAAKAWEIAESHLLREGKVRPTDLTYAGSGPLREGSRITLKFDPDRGVATLTGETKMTHGGTVKQWKVKFPGEAEVSYTSPKGRTVSADGRWVPEDQMVPVSSRLTSSMGIPKDIAAGFDILSQRWRDPATANAFVSTMNNVFELPVVRWLFGRKGLGQLTKVGLTTPFIAHHVLNFMGNVWNMTLHGVVNPKAFLQGFNVWYDMVKTGGTTMIDTPGFKGTVRELVDTMVDNRAAGYGTATTEELRFITGLEQRKGVGAIFESMLEPRGPRIPFTSKRILEGPKGTRIRATLRETAPALISSAMGVIAADKMGLPLSSAAMLSGPILGIRFGRRIGQFIENWHKTTVVLDRLNKGYTLYAAIKSTKDILFDYGHLSPFEKIVARRVILFYTWPKKNLPLMVRTFAERPGLLSQINSFRTAIKNSTDPDRGLVDTAWLSEWAKQGLVLGMGPGGDGGPATAWMVPGIGINDAAELTNAALSGDFENVVQRVNPLIRVFSSFLAGKIADEEMDSVAPAIFEAFPDGFKEMIGFRPVMDRKGNLLYFRADPRMLAVFTAFGSPLQRATGQAGQFGAKPPTDVATPLLKAITGISRRDLTPQVITGQMLRGMMDRVETRLKDTAASTGLLYIEDWTKLNPAFMRMKDGSYKDARAELREGAQVVAMYLRMRRYSSKLGLDAREMRLLRLDEENPELAAVLRRWKAFYRTTRPDEEENK